MRYFAFVSFLVLLCSGCANQNVWVNPTKNATEAHKDLAECKYDSNKSSFVPYGNDTSPISAGIQEGFQSSSLMAQCMRSRGYNLVNRQELEEKKANYKIHTDAFNLAMKNKDFNKALEIANNAISQFPSQADAYYGRGNAYYSLKKYNEAIADYNKAISLGYKKVQVFIYKAQAFIELKEYDIAIEIINQALTTNNDSSLYNTRAYVLNTKGDYDKAIEDCNKSIALDTNKPNAYKNRGLAYSGKKEYEKAIEQFNKAISIDPTYMYAYDGRGDTYIKLANKDKAMADFKTACDKGLKISCDKMKN